MVDKKIEENIPKFCGITGATIKEARKYLTKYKRLDAAIDAFYNDDLDSDDSLPSPPRKSKANSAPSTSTLNKLFDKYKDSDSDEITVDGTIKLCEDLSVDPEDVVMLAVAYELKSPRMGQWTRKGWVEGWQSLRCDSIAAMQKLLPTLRDQLSSDPDYFQNVYNHTFDFARNEGQRSLAIDTAQALWALLLPIGLEGGALSHIPTPADEGQDDEMDGSEEGWQEEHTEWWFEFLRPTGEKKEEGAKKEKGVKGVSRDTWQMFLEFVRSIDSKFSNYDPEAAWPSTIDDFVDYAKGRLAN